MVRRHLDTARSAAESANRPTHAITSNATLGLVMMDARQYCTFMNPAAEQLFGLTFAEVQATNRPLHYVVHHTRPDGTPFPMEACPMDRALPERLQEQGEDVLVHRDGVVLSSGFHRQSNPRKWRAGRNGARSGEHHRAPSRGGSTP